MNFRRLALAAIALIIALPAARAQPAPDVIPPPEKSLPAAPGAVDCANAANKTLPACVKDKGIARPPPPAAEDPAIRRAPPPTGDPIANPRASAPPLEKK